MEDAVHAIIMAFSMFVFVIGLSVAMYMFQEVTTTADAILYYTDETNYYDNLKIEHQQTAREVDIDTAILTLYRYYKENFCVKIYDAPKTESDNEELLQVFDINLETEARAAASMTDAVATPKQKALKKIYNVNSKPIYLFEAPWVGSTEDAIKKRLDYYINGSSGYINNVYINYENNKFNKIRNYNKTVTDENKVYFKEEFIRYTYTGETIVTDDGEILVEGAAPEDKIVVIYTATKYLNI